MKEFTCVLWCFQSHIFIHFPSKFPSCQDPSPPFPYEAAGAGPGVIYSVAQSKVAVYRPDAAPPTAPPTTTASTTPSTTARPFHYQTNAPPAPPSPSPGNTEIQ